MLTRVCCVHPQNILGIHSLRISCEQSVRWLAVASPLPTLPLTCTGMSAGVLVSTCRCLNARTADSRATACSRVVCRTRHLQRYASSGDRRCCVTKLPAGDYASQGATRWLCRRSNTGPMGATLTPCVWWCYSKYGAALWWCERPMWRPTGLGLHDSWLRHTATVMVTTTTVTVMGAMQPRLQAALS